MVSTILPESDYLGVTPNDFCKNAPFALNCTPQYNIITKAQLLLVASVMREQQDCLLH
jgi:hypothetical protein